MTWENNIYLILMSNRCCIVLKLINALFYDMGKQYIFHIDVKQMLYCSQIVLKLINALFYDMGRPYIFRIDVKQTLYCSQLINALFYDMGGPYIFRIDVKVSLNSFRRGAGNQ